MQQTEQQLGYEKQILIQREVAQLDDSYNYSRLEPYQLYMKYTIHPLCDKYRFLLKFGTGLGKTVSSLIAARNFIDRGLHVVIVTFNKQVFYNEFLKFEELGFITQQERELLQNPELSKRITSKVMQKINKQITFFGYKELQLQLFWYDHSDQSIKLNLNIIQKMLGGLVIFDEIHNVYSREGTNTWGLTIQFLSNLLDTQSHFLYMSATPLTNPEEITDLVKLMKIPYKYKHIRSDNDKRQIHLKRNNINEQQIVNDQDIQTNQYKFDMSNQNQKINNTILKTAEQFKQYVNNQKDKKSQESDNSELKISKSASSSILDIDELQLQKGIQLIYQKLPQLSQQESIDQLSQIMNKRVAFIPDLIRDMPKVQYIGDQYMSIKYLKFIRCETNSYWEEYYNNTTNYLQDEEWRKHICLNMPQQNTTLDQFFKNYIKQDKQVIQWCQQNQIAIKQQKLGTNIFTGNFMKIDNIQKFSPKFYTLIKSILQNKGKSFIYTNYVINFGTNFIQELLKINGLIEYDQIPSQNTICYLCRYQYKDHFSETSQSQIQKQCKEFTPYRFILVTGENVNQHESQLRLFNSQYNINGEKIQVVIGSQIIREGYNLLGINNAYVLSIPFGIPMLMQVLGRAIRNKSHQNLEKSMQYVNINILLTSGQNTHLLDEQEFHDVISYSNKLMNERQKRSDGDNLLKNEKKLQYQQNAPQKVKNYKGTSSHKYFKIISREEIEYFQKMKRYLQIQEYEKIIHESADDIQLYKNLYFDTQYMRPNSKKDINNQLIDGSVYRINATNPIKMLPFQITSNIKDYDYNQDPENIYFNPYAMNNFYFLDVGEDIIQLLKQILLNKFKQKYIWELNELIDEIRNSRTSINLHNIPYSDFLLQIKTLSNVYILDNYAIYSESIPDYNTFLSSNININQKNQLYITLNFEDTIYSQQSLQQIIEQNELFYIYICQQFPIYIFNMLAGHKLINDKININENQFWDIRQYIELFIQNQDIQKIQDLFKISFDYFYNKLTPNQDTSIQLCKQHINGIQHSENDLSASQCNQCQKYIDQVSKLNDYFKYLVLSQLLIMIVSNDDIFKWQNMSIRTQINDSQVSYFEEQDSKKQQKDELQVTQRNRKMQYKFIGFIDFQLQDIYINDQSIDKRQSSWRTMQLNKQDLVNRGYIIITKKNTKIDIVKQTQSQDKRLQQRYPICQNLSSEQLNEVLKVFDIKLDQNVILRSRSQSTKNKQQKRNKNIQISNKIITVQYNYQTIILVRNKCKIKSII